jgi:hypothetical protein
VRGRHGLPLTGGETGPWPLHLGLGEPRAQGAAGSELGIQEDGLGLDAASVHGRVLRLFVRRGLVEFAGGFFGLGSSVVTLSPLFAAPRRCFSAMSLIFLALRFFFEPEGRWPRSRQLACASRPLLVEAFASDAHHRSASAVSGRLQGRAVLVASTCIACGPCNGTRAKPLLFLGLFGIFSSIGPGFESPRAHHRSP